MEFLMTYGWAILVVLIVIGALAYFGVLSPSTLLPEKCTFPISLSCTDFSVTTSTISLVLQNGAGRDMSVTQVRASSDALSGGPCTTGAITTIVRNGDKNTFALAACTFADTGRDKNRYVINVTYNWLDSSSITHQIDGQLLAKVTTP